MPIMLTPVLKRRLPFDKKHTSVTEPVILNFMSAKTATTLPSWKSGVTW